MAQMLKADSARRGTGEDSLHAIARSPSRCRMCSSRKFNECHCQGDDELKYQAFLARTLGLFDLPDVVLPALEQAMQPGVDREVRKNSIGSIAVLADRLSKSGDPLADRGLVDELLKISRDEDPMIRQLCAFTLGLFSDPDTKSRLDVMVDDANLDTRINAAIALARRGDAQGSKVFREVLKSAAESKESGSDDEYEQFVALKNCIKAIESVVDGLNASERTDLIALIEPVAANFREPGNRIAAKNALIALRDAR